MADLVKLSNDTAGATTEKVYFVFGQTGNHTAATNAPFSGLLPRAGRITGVWLGTTTYPTSTDRTLTATVKRNRNGVASVAVCSVDPAFAATASGGTGATTTYAAGTGKTLATIKSDGSEIVAAGDFLTTDIAIAGANGTVGTGAVVTVEVTLAAV